MSNTSGPQPFPKDISQLKIVFNLGSDLCNNTGMRIRSTAAGIALLVGLGVSLLAACQRIEAPPSPLRFSLEPIPGRLIADEGKTSVDSPAILQDPDFFVWGGSVVQGEDGRFHADEVLLKCPTRYEEELPDQAEGA